jgi:predicted nucleotidyltransferase
VLVSGVCYFVLTSPGWVLACLGLSAEAKTTPFWEIVQEKRSRQREQLRLATLKALREALVEVLPGRSCVIFGSVLRPGRFHERSDVDLALWDTPRGLSAYRLQAALEERLGRPVDLVLLPESRLRDKILQEGELWTNSD